LKISDDGSDSQSCLEENRVWTVSVFFFFYSKEEFETRKNICDKTLKLQVSGEKLKMHFYRNYQKAAEKEKHQKKIN